MRLYLCGLGVALLIAGCTTQQPTRPDLEDAIRFGIEVCERHLLEGVAFDEALSASARGRSFSLETGNVEHWPRSDQPYRLMGQRVWVGADNDDAADPDDSRNCDVVAIGGGSPALRDAIVREHVARTDRTWTDKTANARGKKAVCTLDRVAAGKSLLLFALVRDPWGVDTVAIPDSPQVFISMEVQDTCDRGYDYWL